MSPARLKFRHVVIDANPPGVQNDIWLPFDGDGDGLLYIVIGSKKGDAILYWYQYPG